MLALDKYARDVSFIHLQGCQLCIFIYEVRLVQADAEALRSAAPALNKYAGDGSFMDQALAGSCSSSRNPLQAALQAGQCDTAGPAASPNSPRSSPESDAERDDAAAPISQDHPSDAKDRPRHHVDHDDHHSRAGHRPRMGAGSLASGVASDAQPSAGQSANGRQREIEDRARQGPTTEAGSLREASDAAAAPIRMPTAGPDASEGGNKSAAAALRARLLVGSSHCFTMHACTIMGNCTPAAAGSSHRHLDPVDAKLACKRNFQDVH